MSDILRLIGSGIPGRAYASPSMRRRRLAVVVAIAMTGCDNAPNESPPTETLTADTLGAIVISEAATPAGTTFFRAQRGAASATQLVQDEGPLVQVSVQRGLVDAITREFGTPGIIAMLLEGAPTESLDPTRDVWVASAALDYANPASARDALAVFIGAKARRDERGRSVELGDGGASFRGRFLGGMSVVTHLWRNDRFVLQLNAVGGVSHSEIRAISRAMDDRVP
jgi:hypothetical protein